MLHFRVGLVLLLSHIGQIGLAQSAADLRDVEVK
jgi:hypothetical protein